jgi:outer membrane protein TolC
VTIQLGYWPPYAGSFPTISLAGAFGYASSDPSNLFQGSARVWSYAGSLAGPIFTGDAIASQIKQAEAARSTALFNSHVNIYKAMGGGWQVAAEPMPVLPPKW